MSRHQTTGQNYDINITNKSFQVQIIENDSPNQNYVHKEMKSSSESSAFTSNGLQYTKNCNYTYCFVWV